MIWKCGTHSLAVFLVMACLASASPTLRADVIERDEVLDPNGRFRVHWKYYPLEKALEFEVTAETTGFVGFGLSPVGGMAGADIVIGGIHPNGTTYFSVKVLTAVWSLVMFDS